ncbi:gfo/Idh/MocA family oxidoreductase [Rhodohalobacter sp. SW132]|uniref:Gfo/Idh/MocA family protein n=1 Tax=Rhodohalobacter sp. SW132 TaxID=2293433 RepID=UPI000E26F8C4|nr:Gfo/Idh/MocA family oxidoreductase [Rhodohalobacter sp. SW132]REL39045.1 gfo/Idh/MocA family oxidoreductase [Rhodohalobacter sp. SW132]
MENKNLWSTNISRKDFVKKTSLFAGGGLLLGSLPVGVSAYAAGNDTLKVAVIGCGGRGTGAANQALNADPGVKIVALADLFRDRIDQCYDALSQHHLETGRLDVPEEHKFTGFDSYKEATALADVVILTAPPGFRPAHFEEAVKAGKHMFIEKPVATDAPGVRRVLEAAKEAREKNLNMVLGLQRRYQNNYRETYKRLQDGIAGDIVSGQVYWNDGGVWVREREADMGEVEYQVRNWFYFTWLAGDHILEQNIHNIDVANWYIGEYPETAQGMGGREVRTDKKFGQIFDHHFVEYTYPGGAVISAQCRHQQNTFSRVAENFQGTRSNIYVDFNNRAEIRGRDGTVHFDHDGMNDPNPYQQEHDELFAAIRSGEVIDDIDYGAKTTLAAIMGRMATYSGQMITWEEAMNSDAQLMPDYVAWDMEPPVLPDENGYYPVPVPGVSRPH